MKTDETSYPTWRSDDVLLMANDGYDLANIEYKFVIAALDVCILHQVDNTDISWIEYAQNASKLHVKWERSTQVHDRNRLINLAEHLEESRIKHITIEDNQFNDFVNQGVEIKCLYNKSIEEDSFYRDYILNEL